MSGEHGGPTVPPASSPPEPPHSTHAYYPPPPVDGKAPATTSPSCFACGRPPLIFERLAAVTRSVRAVAKKGYNSEHNYSFRSIDDFYNALSPALGEHQVIIQPNIIERVREVKGKTRGGADIVSLQTRTRFRLFTVDGSFMEVDIDSESIDYGGDKAPFKAASGAYKYLVMQVFAVQVAQEETPESEHDDGRPDRGRPRGAPPSKWKGNAAPPARGDLDNPDAQGLDAGPELKPLEEKLRKRLGELTTLVDFEAWATDWRAAPAPVKAALRQEGIDTKAKLTDAAAKAEADAASKAAEAPQVPPKAESPPSSPPPVGAAPKPEAPPRPVVSPTPAPSSSSEPCWELGPDGAQCQQAAGHGGPHKDGAKTWPQARKRGKS